VQNVNASSILHSFTYSTREHQNTVHLRVGVRLRVHVERSLDINQLSAPLTTQQLRIHSYNSNAAYCLRVVVVFAYSMRHQFSSDCARIGEILGVLDLFF